MVLVNHVGMNGENFVYSTSFKDVFHVREFVGGKDAYDLYLKEVTVAYIVVCFEEFLILEKNISPQKNQLQSYEENKSNIKGFITWALGNDHLIDKILSTSLKIVKKANLMIKEMPSDHEDIKYLMFYTNCVTLSVNSRNRIEI